MVILDIELPSGYSFENWKYSDRVSIFLFECFFFLLFCHCSMEFYCTKLIFTLFFHYLLLIPGRLSC